jgi:uncharacterized protein YbaR (Trm112 family)
MTTVSGYELLVCPACGTERLRRSHRVAQPCRCGERVQAYEIERGAPIVMRGVAVGSGVAWVGEAALREVGAR